MNYQHLAELGWHLIGRYSDDGDDVGAWIIVKGNEGIFVEAPPFVKHDDVRKLVEKLGVTMIGWLTSHGHYDHEDRATIDIYDSFIEYGHDYWDDLYLLSGMKHSFTDTIIVYRGVAFTGDVELESYDSCNGEVPEDIRKASMRAWQNDLPDYHIHTVFSAHLNDYRENVNWKSLFAF